MDKRKFKYVESEIEDYPDNKKLLESNQWEEDIILAKTGSDDIGVHSGIGNPTEKKGIHLITIRERMRNLEIVHAINFVLSSLPEDKYRFIELWYWTKPRMLSDEGIASSLNVDRSTLYRWKREIVYAVAQKIGIPPF